VLDESTIDLSRVQVLTKVKIRNLVNNAEMTYSIVSEKEADLKAGKISSTSPIGKGLVGKSKGEIAEIQVPSGLMKFEILEISL
jgi:transcription elongation factor GreA